MAETESEKKARVVLERQQQKAKEKFELQQTKAATRFTAKLTPVVASLEASTYNPSFTLLPDVVTSPTTSSLTTFSELLDACTEILRGVASDGPLPDVKDVTLQIAQSKRRSVMACGMLTTIAKVSR